MSTARNALPILAMSTVPSGSTTVEVEIPDGHYYLSVHVKSNLTGTTTQLLLTPYVDSARSQLSDLNYLLVEADEAVSKTSITFPAGAAGRVAHVQPYKGASDPAPKPVGIVGGLGVVFVKGTAVEGETFEVVLLAHRVS